MMFKFKEFEFCNIYYNPYEDIEIVQGTVDHIGIDVYCSGQHIFECSTIKEVDQFLKKIGVSFEVGN